MNSYSSDQIYQATYQACQRLSRQDLDRSSAKLDRYHAGFTESDDYNESRKHAYDEYQFKQATISGLWLIEQEDYKKALHNCYAQDAVMLRYFDKLVLRADLRGKVVVGVVYAASFAAFGKLLQWVYKGSVVVGHALAYGFPVATISSMISDIAKQKELVKLAEEKCKSEKVAADRCASHTFLTSIQSMSIQSQGTAEERTKSNNDFFIDALRSDIEKIKVEISRSQSEQEHLRLEQTLRKKQAMLENLKAIAP